MTVSLDQIIKVGPLRIALLSDRAVKAIHCNGFVFFTGRKHPVAVLIRQGAALNAYELDGHPLTRAHVEKLCPGAWRCVRDAR
ncbi:hypothetical protein [Sulfitobacter sp. MF3-043]|uniref:hypothetical protein n=1 Tax=Sulfitobacter sediminivivens TaxID=3252902 RepID=UPI0036D967A6